MKTLVIHPVDHTTDFLKPIYEGKDWTVINTKVSRKQLKTAIKEHDRIIMLGHGTEQGLIGFEGYGFAVNSSMVYALRDKECVCIWCNAHAFVRKYRLKGFYTGMIISERDEAMYCALYEATDAQVKESNILFADAVKNAIVLSPDKMLEQMKQTYQVNSNPVVDYNSQRLFVNQ